MQSSENGELHLSPLNYSRALFVKRMELHFDFNIYTGWQVQIHQGVNYLRTWVGDINEPFVDSHFKLLPGILINKTGTVNRVFVDSGWQWHRTNDDASAPFDGINDLPGGFINDLVVIRFQFYPNPLANFNWFFFFSWHVYKELPSPGVSRGSGLFFTR